MGAARAAKRRSIRERSKARRANRTFYDMVVGDGDLTGLSAALTKAEGYLSAVRIVKLDDEAKKAEMVAAAQAAHDAALVAVEEHRDRIWFEALPEPEYEALRLAHPMPDEGERKPGELWSFIPALIAACAVDYDSDADEWAETLAGWSRAEKEAIAAAVSEANLKPASLILGKG